VRDRANERNELFYCTQMKTMQKNGARNSLFVSMALIFLLVLVNSQATSRSHVEHEHIPVFYTKVRCSDRDWSSHFLFKVFPAYNPLETYSVDTVSLPCSAFIPQHEEQTFDEVDSL